MALVSVSEDPGVTIPDDAWEETGEYLGEGRERDRLMTTIRVNGVPLHLEAFRVLDADHEDNPDRELSKLVDSDADAAVAMIVGDGGYPLSTTTIAGVEYVLVATPYGA